MPLEGTIYCDGPECEVHAPLGITRFDRSGKLVSLPPGFVRTIEYSEVENDERVFCGHECLMKWAATFPPEETVSLEDS